MAGTLPAEEQQKLSVGRWAAKKFPRRRLRCSLSGSQQSFRIEKSRRFDVRTQDALHQFNALRFSFDIMARAAHVNFHQTTTNPRNTAILRQKFSRIVPLINDTNRVRLNALPG
jgi:hypothetical protein